MIKIEKNYIPESAIAFLRPRTRLRLLLDCTIFNVCCPQNYCFALLEDWLSILGFALHFGAFQIFEVISRVLFDQDSFDSYCLPCFVAIL